MLIPARKWIRETFESGVSTKRVRKWVEKGLIPGIVIDDLVFVYADRAAILLDTHTVLDTTQTEPPESGTAKIASIVQAGLTR